MGALSIRKIIGLSFTIYKNNLIKLIDIALIPAIIIAANSYLVNSKLPEMQFLSIFVLFLTALIGGGALIFAVYSIYRQETMSIFISYKESLKHLGSVFLYNIIFALLITLSMFPLICVAIVLLSGDEQYIRIISLLIMLPYAIYLLTKTLIAFPAIIIEGLGPVEGIKKSWRLTTDHFWLTLGTNLTSGMIVVLFVQLPGLLFTMGISLIINNSNIAILLFLVIEIITLLIIMPFTYIVQVILFLELEAREDIELNQESEIVITEPLDRSEQLPKNNLLPMTTCPNCQHRVLPKLDGSCPSCQKQIS